MSPPADRLARLRRKTRLSEAAALVAVAAAAAFALRPIEATRPGISPTPAPSAAREEVQADRFDAGAFDVVLWHPLAGAASRPSDAEESTGGPRALELVGITQERGVLVAALYDRGADRLFLVKHGEKVRGQAISKITPGEVELAGEEGAVTLALRRSKP